MAGISVERSSFKPRVRESFIDVPRIRLAVSDRVRNTESVVGKIDEVLKIEKPREDAGVDQIGRILKPKMSARQSDLV